MIKDSLIEYMLRARMVTPSVFRGLKLQSLKHYTHPSVYAYCGQSLVQRIACMQRSETSCQRRLTAGLSPLFAPI